MVEIYSHSRIETRSIGVGTSDRFRSDDDSLERMKVKIDILEKELVKTREELDTIRNVIGQGQINSAVCQEREILLDNSGLREIDDRVLILGDSLFKYSASYTTARGFNSWCFPGIRFEQLGNMVERYVGVSKDLVFIHVGTHNIYDITAEVFRLKFDRLIISLRNKFQGAKLIFSGIIYRRDVDFTRINWANNILESVCSKYDCKFINSNSYLDYKDLGKNGINLNRSGSYKLGKVCIDSILEYQKN